MPVTTDKVQLLAKLRQLNDLKEENNRLEVLQMGKGAQPAQDQQPQLGVPSDRVPTSTLPDQPRTTESYTDSVKRIYGLPPEERPAALQSLVAGVGGAMNAATLGYAMGDEEKSFLGEHPVASGIGGFVGAALPITKIARVISPAMRAIPGLAKAIEFAGSGGRLAAGVAENAAVGAGFGLAHKDIPLSEVGHTAAQFGAIGGGLSIVGKLARLNALTKANDKLEAKQAKVKAVKKKVAPAPSAPAAGKGVPGVVGGQGELDITHPRAQFDYLQGPTFKTVEEARAWQEANKHIGKRGSVAEKADPVTGETLAATPTILIRKNPKPAPAAEKQAWEMTKAEYNLGRPLPTLRPNETLLSPSDLTKNQGSVYHGTGIGEAVKILEEGAIRPAVSRGDKLGESVVSMSPYRKVADDWGVVSLELKNRDYPTRSGAFSGDLLPDIEAASKKPVPIGDIKAVHIQLGAEEGLSWRDPLSGITIGELKAKFEKAGIPVKIEKGQSHKSIVQDAVKAGKPVPPEVLKDYPDLAKKELVRPTESLQGGFGAAAPSSDLGVGLSHALKKARAERGSADLGDLVVDVVRKEKAPGLGSLIATPTNYVGAIPGHPQRFGSVAAEVVQKSVLAERNIRTEAGLRDESLAGMVRRIPKKDYGKRGEVFFEAIEGKKLSKVEADPRLSPETKTVAKELKASIENDRQWLRDDFRNQNRSWVTEEVNRAFREEMGLAGKKLTKAQRAELNGRVDKRLAEIVPDDWGIPEYLPHIFPGEYLVKVKGADGKYQTIGSAGTPMEAMSVVAKAAVNDPALKTHDFQVISKSKTFMDPDLIRLSKGKYFRTISDLQSELNVSPKDVAEAARGNFGMMMSRKKWWGNIQKRLGAEGYSKDFEKVMQIYNRGIARYKHLTQLNREVQPLLEQLRSEGRADVADYAEWVFNNAWGNRNRGVSGMVDNMLQSLPITKNVVGPFALDRFLSTFIKTPIATYKWKTSPRGQLLNLAQTAQTLMPLGPGEYAAGLKFYASAEGKAALSRHGVRFFAGRPEEGAKALTPARLREKMGAGAPETFNQEVAFSTLYNKARKMGYDDAAAADYAFLKGNVYTQFTPMATDVPKAFHGPVASTIMMFQRFKIKDYEIGINLFKTGQFNSFSRWVGMKWLIGGTKAITNPIVMATGGGYVGHKVYNKMREELGDGPANIIAYGLPGIVGLDMSYSMQWADIPRGDDIAQGLGNTLLGPAGSDAIAYVKAYNDRKGPERSAAMRVLKQIGRQNPGFPLRWIETLFQLQEGADNGLYNFRTSSGQLRFKNDMTAVFINAMGGKVIGEKTIVDGKVVDLGPFDVWIGGMVDLEAKRREVIDIIAQNIIAEKPYEQEWLDWMAMYPEIPILKAEIAASAKAKYMSQELTQRERTLRRAPKAQKVEFGK